MEVTCICVGVYQGALTWGHKYVILESDEEKKQVRVRTDSGRLRWFPDYCFDMTGNARSIQPYTIWLEAEHWEPGQWNPRDDNLDVAVTFADGTRWVATFFTYTNIATLRAHYQESGECLSGKYFWASDMILVDEVSRERIEEVIDHLLKECAFERVFTCYSGAETDSTHPAQEYP
jgi:hypothetical protein